MSAWINSVLFRTALFPKGDSCIIAEGEELRPESVICFERDPFRKTNAFLSVSEMLLEIQ